MAKNVFGGSSESEEERISRKPLDRSAEAKRDDGKYDNQEGTYLSAVDRGEGDGDGARANVSAMDDDEMEEFLRNEFLHQVLPACPDIPGFHTCWLSTTNQYDTIPYRMRLGYTPVTQEDVPAFKATTVRTGEYSGMIGVNEMLLFKIPNSRYQKIMHEFHHRRPADEEERLRANLELMQGGELSKGRQMIAEMGDGTEEMLKRINTKSPNMWE